MISRMTFLVVLFLSLTVQAGIEVKAQEVEIPKITLRNSFGKKITIWFMPSLVGKWRTPGLSFIHNESRIVEFKYAGTYSLQIQDLEGARIFVTDLNFSRHALMYGSKPIDLKMSYRRESRTRNVTVQKSRTETKTRSVPLTKMTMETKTRSVPITRTRTETKTRSVLVTKFRPVKKTRQVPVVQSDGSTKLITQEYTVQVPYTENIQQEYTVQVPYTEIVQQEYTVQVPYTTFIEQTLSLIHI